MPDNDSIACASALPLASVLLGLIGALGWLISLVAALTRDELDPVRQLMWVVVVVFTSLLSAIRYLVMAPSRPKVKLVGLPPDDTREPTICVTCDATIPAGADVCPKYGWSYSEAPGGKVCD